MNPFGTVIFAALACLGHVAIAVWLFNRLHAVGWPRPVVKTLEKLLLLAALLTLIAGFTAAFTWPGQGGVIWYQRVCLVACLAAIPLWLVPKLRERTPAALESNDTTIIDVAARVGFRPVCGAEGRFLAAIPGNELLTIAVQRKTLRLASLPRELDGLTIAHLTDLHMTGQLGREFYDVVVDETNGLDADFVVITGDILERERCLPWIEPTLGRLTARLGKYFILGNHEQRLRDVGPLRQALSEAGLVDLGSKCELVEVRGTPILLAGTERPWFGCVPELSHVASGQPPFRILLSHTADQLPFARRHGFDLMLAGHNHGGQIRLPYVGAIITPSFYGSRYAGGVYWEPPTLLHVSRGLAGIHPIRLNCPPEIALLTLRAAE